MEIFFAILNTVLAIGGIVVVILGVWHLFAEREEYNLLLVAGGIVAALPFFAAPVHTKTREVNFRFYTTPISVTFEDIDTKENISSSDPMIVKHPIDHKMIRTDYYSTWMIRKLNSEYSIIQDVKQEKN